MTCKEKVLSEEYQDFLTYYLLSRSQDGEENAPYCSIPITDRLLSVYYDRSYLPKLSFAEYNYRYVTEIYGLMDVFFPESVERRFDPQPLIRSGISAMQKGPLFLTGRNVVIGFADTGIDYRNPVFRRQDGSSRILAIWDQTDQSGMPPEGFVYGSEYTREQIDEALGADDPLSVVPTFDEIGHGTAMAAAAAGSALNSGLDFLGAAPEADIVVVKLKQAKQFLREFQMIPEGVPAYEANDIILAVKYLDSFVLPYERPVVLCLGIGKSFGAYQGNSILERYLSGVSLDVNRVVVTAGGNEGNSAHHYSGTVSGAESEEVELRVEEGTKGFLMEIWGEVSNYFTLSIRSPSGEEVPPLSGRLRGSWEYSFVYGGTRIALDYQLNDQVTGSEVAVMRFEAPIPGIWTLRLVHEGTDGGGSFHIWLPIRQFVEGGAEFLRPDPSSTLTAPSYASGGIAVTAYDSGNNSFYINSGQGFGFGRRKPDIAAPGVDISTAMGMLGGRTVVGKSTGTSMAAALTAGACAQLFQWAVAEGNYSDINGVGIKNYLVRGAVRDAAYVYPNRQWGYGRLDLEGTFNWIAGI